MQTSVTFALLPNSDYTFSIYCQIKQVVLNDVGRSKEYILEKVKNDHRSKFSNLSNWKEEA